jgi:hypothetical protein
MMAKWYNTETRNDQNEFYRRGDWSVERAADWTPPHGNFTDVAPPAECLTDDPVACDWNGSSWDVDSASQTAKDDADKKAKYREKAILLQAKAEATADEETDVANAIQADIDALDS